MTALPVIALTPGEPAGIGPDLTVMLAARAHDARIVAIADPALLAARARQLGLSLQLQAFDPATPAPATGILEYVQVPMAAGAVAGQLDPRNGAYVLATLDAATDGCLNGQFDAWVTAPVHKGVINDAGMPFSGHTEYIAARTHTPQVVMMLVGGGLRVALATTHLPLKDVAAAIHADQLETTLRIIDHDLRHHFGIPRPRILVAGLNPHAGESGHLGREEIDIIIPVMHKLAQEGLQLTGPLPADTLFTPHWLQSADCVLAMYHDQGLPVLKHASFGQGVNVTLGLPIIRTSVDHGTALDLAGTGRIHSGSLDAALALAVDLAARRKGH